MNIMFILTEKSTCSNKVRKFVSVLKLTQMVIIIAFFGPARKRPAFKTNVWCSVTSFYRNILNDQQHFQMKKNSMDAFITRNVFISANNYVISIILVAVGVARFNYIVAMVILNSCHLKHLTKHALNGNPIQAINYYFTQCEFIKKVANGDF